MPSCDFVLHPNIGLNDTLRQISKSYLGHTISLRSYCLVWMSADCPEAACGNSETRARVLHAADGRARELNSQLNSGDGISLEFKRANEMSAGVPSRNRATARWQYGGASTPSPTTSRPSECCCLPQRTPNAHALHCKWSARPVPTRTGARHSSLRVCHRCT